MNDFKKCLIALLCVGLLALCIFYCPVAAYFLIGIIIIALGVIVHVNAKSEEHKKNAIILFVIGFMELICAFIALIYTR